MGAKLAASTRGGTQDIYKSVNWGPAEPVTELNTPFDDSRPNVRHDGKEIVFDSTRTPNLGGPDVWIATRSSTSQPWSAPKHLPGVSSPAADTPRPPPRGDGRPVSIPIRSPIVDISRTPHATPRTHGPRGDGPIPGPRPHHRPGI